MLHYIPSIFFFIFDLSLTCDRSTELPNLLILLSSWVKMSYIFSHGVSRGFPRGPCFYFLTLTQNFFIHSRWHSTLLFSALYHFTFHTHTFTWTAHLLQLNLDKSEILLFPEKCCPLHGLSIRTGSTIGTPAQTSNNLSCESRQPFAMQRLPHCIFLLPDSYPSLQHLLPLL